MIKKDFGPMVSIMLDQDQVKMLIEDTSTKLNRILHDEQSLLEKHKQELAELNIRKEKLRDALSTLKHRLQVAVNSPKKNIKGILGLIREFLSTHPNSTYLEVYEGIKDKVQSPSFSSRSVSAILSNYHKKPSKKKGISFTRTVSLGTHLYSNK